MRFLCDQCSTKYSIADERVRGRVLKIRCKKCDFVITVREEAIAPAVPTGDDLESAFDAALGGGGDHDRTVVGGLADLPAAALGPDDDWYVSFDGEQEGPFALGRAVERVRQERDTDKEAHAWRPGFLVWLPVEEVPELAGALAPARAPAVPVRTTMATPIAPAQRGAVARAIPKDPSGPRAALSVSPAAIGGSRRGTAPLGMPGLPGSSAQARVEPRKSNAPPIPAAAMPDPRSPARGTPASVPLAAAPPLFAHPAAVPMPTDEINSRQGLPAPMFDGPVVASPPASAMAVAVPELAISNEASGLVNLAHLTAAAFGDKSAPPAFINGHTPANGALAAEAAVAMPNASTSAPIVVVAGAAPSGVSGFVKWAAAMAFLGCIGLGVGVWYLYTHRQITDTIIITEPSRRQDDSPITMSDPGNPKIVAPDPKRPPPAAVARKVVAPAVGKSAAPQKGDNLSGSQRALADLYKDDGDRATPRALPGAGGNAAAQGGQVSNQAIIAAVSANKRTLSLCYERALKHDQSLKSGRVPIQVTVGMSGRVTSVTIPEAQYASSELGQCFTQAVKRWSFPAADAAYSTEFPFILQGQ